MEEYRIYEITTAKIKPGKSAQAVAWWDKRGIGVFKASPGTKSVRSYAVQFGLGGEYHLEIWREIEDYGSYDRLDADMLAKPEKYAAFLETTEFLEWGPTRLMGDWPQSQFLMDEA